MSSTVYKYNNSASSSFSFLDAENSDRLTPIMGQIFISKPDGDSDPQNVPKRRNRAEDGVDTLLVKSKKNKTIPCCSGALGQNQEQTFPDVNSPSWYLAPCFEHYWSHYQFVMNWYQKHICATMGTTSSQSSRLSNCSEISLTNHAQHHQNERKSRNSKSKARSRLHQKRKKRRKVAMSSERDESSQRLPENPPSISADDPDVDMEISEDVIDFFATSLKHRMERDNEKSQIQEEIDDSSPTKLHHNPKVKSSFPPKERPGVRRAAEMKLLYGEGSSMIHGMETSLQMMFDRVNDQHQPKLWPNVPLKI